MSTYTAPGSATSAAAARAGEGNARALEARVLSLVTNAGSNGLADFEIDAALASSGFTGTARPRRCSLRDKGLIGDSGKTITNPDTNRRQTRWVVPHFVPDDFSRRAQPETSKAASEEIEERVFCPVWGDFVQAAEIASRSRQLWVERDADADEAELMLKLSAGLRSVVDRLDSRARHLERERDTESTGQHSFDLGER